MNLREFRNLVRVSRLDDNAVQANGVEGTRQWSNAEIDEAAREAQNEAVQRANLLRDDMTPAVAQVAIVAGQSDYPLHPSVYGVDHDFVYLNDRGLSLRETTEEALSCGRDGGYYDAYGYRPVAPFNRSGAWRTATGSRPRLYYLRRAPRGRLYLRLYPIPAEATYVDPAGATQPLVLNLAAYRLPIWPLRVATDQFEIEDRYVRLLIDFVLGRLYEKNDSDANNQQLSQQYFARFDASFGTRDSARTIITRDVERRRETVRGHGF